VHKNNLKSLFVLLLLSSIVFAYPLETLIKERPTGFVTDKTGTLSPGERLDLENRISQIEKNTSAEIALVVIDTLEGESIEYYTVQLMEKWGIGKKEINNGILVLVVINDRKVRIEVGYGLEPYITDARAGNIIRNDIAPEFVNENYYTGLNNAVTTIEERIKSDPEVSGQTSERFSEAALISGGLGSFSNFVSGIVGGTGLFIVILLIIIGIALGMKWTGSKLKETKAKSIMQTVSNNFYFFFMIVIILVIPFSVIIGGLMMIVILTSVISVSPNRVMMVGGYWGGGRGGFGGSGGGGGFGGFGGGFSGGGGAGGGW